MSRPRQPAEVDGCVCLGVIAGAKGIQGEVRIKAFADDPKGIGDYGPLRDAAGRRFDIKVAGESKGLITVRIKGVADRNAAEALKGTALYLERDRLPEPDEDEFYFDDLVGLRADLAAGGCLGTVIAVHDFGAGAMLEIGATARDQDVKGAIMVPFTQAAVPEVLMAERRVVIDPPVGLLEPAEPESSSEPAPAPETGNAP